jgi:hypothetical protein
MKDGRTEGWKDGRNRIENEGYQGINEGRKEGKKDIKEGRTEGWKEGRKEKIEE